MKDKLPFISVILPTYNNDSVLLDCLQSIFVQDYPKFEVLIIDGGSSDKTIEIAKKFSVKVLKNPYRVEEKGNPKSKWRNSLFYRCG